MKKTWWIIAGICCSGAVLTFAVLPARKANLDYVRSATAIQVMHEFKEPGMLLRIEAEPGNRPGVSLVSGRAVAVSPSENGGLLAETKTTYTFNGQTKSYCLEIEPGCLDIDRGPLSKSVAVRVLM